MWLFLLMCHILLAKTCPQNVLHVSKQKRTFFLVLTFLFSVHLFPVGGVLKLMAAACLKVEFSDSPMEFHK